MAAPAFTYQLGSIVGVCFPQEGSVGIWYSTSIYRLFTDANKVERKAHTFGVKDLPLVQHVAEECWKWILQQYKTSKEESVKSGEDVTNENENGDVSQV